MHIQKVISYKGAWESALDKYRSELSEIVAAFDEYISTNSSVNFEGRQSPRATWEKALREKGWEVLERNHFSVDGRRIPMGSVGPVKNGVGAQITFGLLDTLSRWIFQQSALAVRHKLFQLPVLCVPTTEMARNLFRDRSSPSFRMNSFDPLVNQLELLSPLSHSFPFLILGMSNQAIATSPTIVNIESDTSTDRSATTIDRCIKFPPQYHQAGIGILNFFSTYLMERYPDEDAAISIEQSGLNVRLTIETPGGKSEVIEKALHEFELIVSGREAPEKFTNNDKLILELRNEMRIAKARVEFQQDLIGVKDKQIDKLMTIIEQGLSRPNPITIDFKPNLINTNNIQFNKNISAALGNISELLDAIPTSSPESLMLTEVAGSLETIESETDPAIVRKSPAMSKFKRVIDKFLSVGDEANTNLSKIEDGINNVKDLGKKYNSIAEWCGLPVIPSILVN